MLDASVLRDLGHEDELQRALAVAFAGALHSHRCRQCGQLCVCTVATCEARRVVRLDLAWTCYRCQGAAHEAVQRAAAGED